MHFFRYMVYRTGLLVVGLLGFVLSGSGYAATDASSGIWVNSLGMNFRPIPGKPARLSIWETRVRDFAAFVAATGHDGSDRFFYYQDTSWRMDTNDWRTPGFVQTEDFPVVGISWRDAVRFCDWLTMNERSKGVISDREAYRLPTEVEWDAAAEGTVNPMGLMNAANLHPVLNADPFPNTSPVGSFPANPHGFHDMSGNAWEYCIDRINERQPYRIIRGGGWQNWHKRYVGVEARGQCGIDVRITLYGFRVVLAADDATTEAMREAAGLTTTPR